MTVYLLLVDQETIDKIKPLQDSIESFNGKGKSDEQKMDLLKRKVGVLENIQNTLLENCIESQNIIEDSEELEILTYWLDFFSMQYPEFQSEFTEHYKSPTISRICLKKIDEFLEKKIEINFFEDYNPKVVRKIFDLWYSYLSKSSLDEKWLVLSIA